MKVMVMVTMGILSNSHAIDVRYGPANTHRHAQIVSPRALVGAKSQNG